MIQKCKVQSVKCKVIVQISKLFSFTLLFYLLTFILLASPAYAQTPSAAQSTVYSLPSNVSPTSPLYTDLLVSNLFHTFSCLSIGQSVIGQPCLTYQMTKNAQGMLQGVPVLSQVDTTGGVLGTTTSLIGMLFTNPPVRTADYLASVGKDLGIVKEAHAQVIGSGAAVLNPILGLWTVSRNISYIIMIIIFVIIGLMVMFRTKINPQTVITAQAALPGLVLGLIMITFSYFFAGLISDMAFVGTNMVGYYFAFAQEPNALNDPDRINLVSKMSQDNVISIFARYTSIVDNGQIKTFLDSFWQYLDGNAKFVLTTLSTFMTLQVTSQTTQFLQAIPVWGAGIQAAINILAGGITAAFPSTPASFLIGFIASLALLYTIVKLLLRLLSAYITIIFLTITAPFQFLFAALPGRQGIASGWILNMLGNILVFPAVLAVFYFVAFILGQSFGPIKVSATPQQQANKILSVAQAASTDSSTHFSIVGPDNFPLFGNLDLSFIKILVAFAALMAIPKIPDIVINTVGKAGQAGQLLGQEIGAGVASGQKYASQFQQGVGTVSQEGSKARGLWGTPGWEREEISGQPGKYHWVRKYSAVSGARPGFFDRKHAP